jgi:serine/threonine protein kinase
VYRGRHIATGHVVALKIINLDTEDDDVGDIQKEISLLQQLMSGVSGGTGFVPNVTKYYTSLMDGPKVWIVMEYAEGGSIRTLVGVLIKTIPWTDTRSEPGPTTEGTTHMLDSQGSIGGSCIFTQERCNTSRYQG